MALKYLAIACVLLGVFLSVVLTASADPAGQPADWAKSSVVSPVFRATRRPAGFAGLGDSRAQSADRPTSRRGSYDDLLQADRAGARKAVPITRGQELGLRFRPDERDPLVRQAYPQLQAGEGYRERFELPAGQQFRPIPKKRKPTYEELQAESRLEEPDLPASPYPMLPMPPVRPGYWP